MYNENPPTKLSISHHNTTMSAELPWDADLDTIMEAFVGCLRGITFGDWVVKGIKEWCEEHLPEEEENEEPDWKDE